MKIRLIENFRAMFYAPFYAAEAIGAYKAEGLDVTILRSPDPTAAASALRSGEADAMWGGPLRVMLTAQDDPAAEFVCFCDGVARDPFLIVGRGERPGFGVADLSGLRLAVVSEVSTPWICLRHDLLRAGVDPASVDVRTGGTMAANAMALRAGDVDAVQLFQPHAEELIEAGYAVWLAAADRGPTAYTTLVTRRPLLAERRDEMAAMVAAMGRSLRWVSTAGPAEIAEAVAPYYREMPRERLTACISRYRALSLWATSPVIAREGFDRLQAAMLATGALRRAIAFETCVDTTMAERWERSAI